MSSMSVQSGIRCNFTCASLVSEKPRCNPFKTSILTKHRAFCLDSPTINIDPIGRIQVLSSSATSEAATEATSIRTEPVPPTQETQKSEVMRKVVEKPRLVLKFVWMEKNIGLGLDRVIPGHGPIPLSPYFFWPRKDAWEELKATLETKPWISQKKMIILLNQATDVINLWQQSGGNLSP